MGTERRARQRRRRSPSPSSTGSSSRAEENWCSTNCDPIVVRVNRHHSILRLLLLRLLLLDLGRLVLSLTLLLLLLLRLLLLNGLFQNDGLLLLRLLGVGGLELAELLHRLLHHIRVLARLRALREEREALLDLLLHLLTEEAGDGRREAIDAARQRGLVGQIARDAALVL